VAPELVAGPEPFRIGSRTTPIDLWMDADRGQPRRSRKNRRWTSIPSEKGVWLAPRPGTKTSQQLDWPSPQAAGNQSPFFHPRAAARRAADRIDDIPRQEGQLVSWGVGQA
jgi:hypothetical protein